MERGRKQIGSIKERVCRICKRLLPAEEFYSVPSRPGVKDYVCKKCNTKLKEEAYIKQRLRKYGKGKILQEIEELNADITLRIRILAEHEKEVRNNEGNISL